MTRKTRPVIENETIAGFLDSNGGPTRSSAKEGNESSSKCAKELGGQPPQSPLGATDSGRALTEESEASKDPSTSSDSSSAVKTSGVGPTPSLAIVPYKRRRLAMEESEEVDGAEVIFEEELVDNFREEVQLYELSPALPKLDDILTGV
ncbi:hypothetical protein JCGZ_01948 [Jatropha curcas]|uniref:Uncharacterized protein n=1 Tax=Jatropha curcas TaxID=180498 RepID=A0A067L1S6_JATCU|nr:hypothetical protein JCGZ_01948 [Jatropha curcas]